MEENRIPINSFMSSEINEISAALSAFQGSIEQPKLEKEVKVETKKGYTYKFKYADLSACVKSAAPALKANGLSVSQIICNGKLITLLSHKSGQWIKSELLLPQQTNDYQSYGSAITYLKRYSYCAILGIVADTDDDANMAMGNQAVFKDNGNNAGKAQTNERPGQGTGMSAEQLAKAFNELNSCKSFEEVQEVYKKWKQLNPKLTANGSPFFNRVKELADQFKTA